MKESQHQQVMKELGIIGNEDIENINTDTNTDTNTSMYKEHLSLLIVRGRSKEYLGKNFSLSELDKMSPKELEKYYKLYEAKQFAKISESVRNWVIDGYTHLCGFLIKPEQKQLDKMNKELKNDYLVTNQLEQWTSYFSFKLGGLMPLISASMITFDNLYPGEKEKENLVILNGESETTNERRNERVDERVDGEERSKSSTTNRKHKSERSKTERSKSEQTKEKTKITETDSSG